MKRICGIGFLLFLSFIFIAPGIVEGGLIKRAEALFNQSNYSAAKSKGSRAYSNFSREQTYSYGKFTY